MNQSDTTENDAESLRIWLSILSEKLGQHESLLDRYEPQAVGQNLSETHLDTSSNYV